MKYSGFNIGVFYKNKLWVEKWFDDFLKVIDDACILRYVKNGYWKFMIELKDGTKIIALNVNNDLRGKQIDKAFVEPTIDNDVIYNVINPLFRHTKFIEVEY